MTQEQVIDNLVSLFEEEVTRIVAEARRATVATLLDRLSITDGVVDRTQGNAKVLQGIEAMFKRAMKDAGYSTMVREYVKAWNGQFVYFQDVLDLIGKQIGKRLKVEWGDRDKALFAQQQGQTVDMLNQVVDAQARAAQTQAMFSVGGLKASALTKRISETLDITPVRASTIADTALSTFYRSIADRGYQQVEKKLKKTIQVLYRYGGPKDKLTRPKCREWLAGTKEKGWTREYIEGLSNGQLPNPFVTCGGFRCRHQWIPDYRVKKRGTK